MVNQKESQPLCGEHATQFGACVRRIGHVVPFTCGAEKIDQTGSCINDRLHEHKNGAKSGSGYPTRSIAVGAKKCVGYAPGFGVTRVAK